MDWRPTLSENSIPIDKAKLLSFSEQQ